MAGRMAVSIVTKNHKRGLGEDIEFLGPPFLFSLIFAKIGIMERNEAGNVHQVLEDKERSTAGEIDHRADR